MRYNMRFDDLIGHECAIAFRSADPEERGYSYYQVHAIDRSAGMICLAEVVMGGDPTWHQLSAIEWVEVPKKAMTFPPDADADSMALGA